MASALAMLATVALPVAVFWCFGLTVLSAIVPWVNAEAIVVSLPFVARSRAALLLLLVVATVGQMAGKCAVYWMARRGTRTPTPRVERFLDQWRSRFERQPWTAPVMIGVSSVTGLPPFYVTTIAAGALRVHFGWFLAAGTIGRLVRFGGIIAATGWWAAK